MVGELSTLALVAFFVAAATSNCNFVRFRASAFLVDWSASVVVDDDVVVEVAGSRTVGRLHFVGLPDFLLLLLVLF